jgi:hypothetical protein
MGGQSGFADPRLAGEQHQRRRVLGRVTQAGRELAKLGFPPDERAG